MTQVFHRSWKKLFHKEALYLTTRQNICKPKTMSMRNFSFQIRLTHVLFPNITSIKRQIKRQEKNRSFPRPIQRGVEQSLQWCEYSRAMQPTVYTRHTAMTQVFHRSWKKNLTRKHCSLHLAKTFVNQKQCPSENSPFKYVWPMCYSQTSQA